MLASCKYLNINNKFPLKQEVTDFVIRRIAKGLEPETICEELMTRCLATDCSMGGLGCDNMTVILVCFLHQQPYSK